MLKPALLLAFILLGLFSPKAVAQIDSLITDSLVYHKLLMIPYDSDQMYLSDAEQDIIRQSDKKPSAYRDYLRKALDYKIAAEVEQIIKCHTLLNDKSDQGIKATAEVYNNSSYRYDEPMKLKHVKLSKIKLRKVKDIPNLNDSRIAANNETIQGDQRYMNAVIEKKEIFENMQQQFGADLFLLINQFEIKTNYNNCIDIERHIYKREVIVSFSIYNSSGKQVDGNIAHAFFPSDSNRPSDIAERTFPQIATTITEHIKALAIK